MQGKIYSSITKLQNHYPHLVEFSGAIKIFVQEKSFAQRQKLQNLHIKINKLKEKQ